MAISSEGKHNNLDINIKLLCVYELDLEDFERLNLYFQNIK